MWRWWECAVISKYRKISKIRRTKSPNLNVFVSSCSCLCPIQWSHVLSREWRCNWSSADRRCSNYIWVMENFIAYQTATYIRDLTVYWFTGYDFYKNNTVRLVGSHRLQIHGHFVLTSVCFHMEAKTKWLPFFRRHFQECKCIFLNANVWISINISLKFVPKDPNNNIPTLVQVMAWRRPGDKPLSEPMVVSLLTHICVTRPQWVNDIVITGFSE